MTAAPEAFPGRLGHEVVVVRRRLWNWVLAFGGAHDVPPVCSRGCLGEALTIAANRPASHRRNHQRRNPVQVEERSRRQVRRRVPAKAPVEHRASRER